MFLCRNSSKNPKMTEGNTDNVVIRKRNDEWSNEFTYENKKMHFDAPVYGDRFIPRRSSSGDRKLPRDSTNSNIDVLDWDIPNNYWLQDYLTEAINNSFQLKEERVLQFHKRLSRNNLNSSFKAVHKNNRKGKDWACKPRRKPLTYSETTHDSIGFSNCFEKSMMDWSLNGQVVACFDDDVIIWKRIPDVSITFYVDSVRCLAFCPKGKYLALGCRISNLAAVELWDVVCIEWDKSGKSIACGVSTGGVYILSIPQMMITHLIKEDTSPIMMIRYSPTMRFMATVDLEGNVTIFSCFNFKVYLCLSCGKASLIQIDWHPWNGTELAIARDCPPKVILLNLSNKKIIASYKKNDKNTCIDSIAFNKITGELLISISHSLPDSAVEPKIIVLSSFNRIVDELTIDGGARFLMWDPDGTKLLTAGDDDSITIWNFYPNNKQKSKSAKSEKSQKSNALKKRVFHGCKIGKDFEMWSTIR